MTRAEDRREITDVRRLAALAHPLRTALLSHLLAVGPRTASECATAVDASPSNCSWHLRQLEKHGFVERAGEATDGREPGQDGEDRETVTSGTHRTVADEIMGRGGPAS